MLAVSRAPWPQIETFKKRMGWHFKWVSSFGSDFNRDYHVSFSKDELEQSKAYYNYRLGQFPSEEAPGVSVFYKDAAGAIFHTYSAYARGLDILVGTYNLLDLVPKGRDEAALPWTMAWVRHHDRYEDQPKQLRILLRLMPIATARSHRPGRLVTDRQQEDSNMKLYAFPRLAEHLEGPRRRRPSRHPARIGDRRSD